MSLARAESRDLGQVSLLPLFVDSPRVLFVSVFRPRGFREIARFRLQTRLVVLEFNNLLEAERGGEESSWKLARGRGVCIFCGLPGYSVLDLAKSAHRIRLAANRGYR